MARYTVENRKARTYNGVKPGCTVEVSEDRLEEYLEAGFEKIAERESGKTEIRGVVEKNGKKASPKDAKVEEEQPNPPATETSPPANDGHGLDPVAPTGEGDLAPETPADTTPPDTGSDGKKQKKNGDK